MTKTTLFFFELQYNLLSDYYAVSDDTTFSKFFPNNHGFVSRASNDFTDMHLASDAAISILTEERDRLSQKFSDIEFSVQYKSVPANEQTPLLGSFVVYDETNDTIVCQAGIYQSVDDVLTSANYFQFSSSTYIS